MLIRIKTKGDWRATFDWFSRMLRSEQYERLDALANMGTQALMSSTPKDTGKTASSWRHSISKKRGTVTITWQNDSFTSQGHSIVLLLQYGHGTGTGGYVQGLDFINPSLVSVFEDIADAAWKVVTS